jgi:hypothetical protein
LWLVFRGKLEEEPLNRNCQKFYESGRTYETTEGTEKHSVSARKKIKRQRHPEVENRLVGRG